MPAIDPQRSVMDLLDLMNELGSRARYGVSPSEKYALMVSGQVPGQPKPFLPGGAAVNPDAERYLSNYLGAQQWGSGPATAFNTFRYLVDDNTPVYAAGLKGARAGGSADQTLQALLASLAVRR